MLNVRYAKKGVAAFIPHTDILELINRGIKRAGYTVNRSEGFNPHNRVFMTLPTPLGVASESEYVTVDFDEGFDVRGFKERFQTALPPGFTVLSFKESKINPNYAKNIVAAEYLIPGLTKAAIDEIKKGFTLGKRQKDGTVVKKEIGDLIIGGEDNKITLPFGSVSVRIVQFAKEVREAFNLPILLSEIVKLNVFARAADGSLLNADEL
ncbi:MAG: TIGR03936 family radical SAM-associated protein [Christensenellaceae bacterium]|jgi:radical SAM-linked protein|nr:TIGR03936 family radical SAM-associated protein [Christensenellaceae bacterium]